MEMIILKHEIMALYDDWDIASMIHKKMKTKKDLKWSIQKWHYRLYSSIEQS